MINETEILKKAKCIGIVKGAWGQKRKEKKSKSIGLITVEINTT